MAFERAGDGHVTTHEHEPAYAARTQELLERYGVAHRATVLVAPLVEQVVEGEHFRWYQLEGLALPDGVDLLFVDGPPEATGPKSRYPALPLLAAYLADEAEIVLDDGRRADETEIATQWSLRDDVVRSEPLPHERKPILLRFRRSA
jgi:predicted O-methyltransferase YrrM